RQALRGQGWMAVTAHPHASETAAQILAAGGSALDAAIAAQMTLTLVEPQSSGIGGGAFLLHFDAARKRVSAWDGRETAPMAADESLFLDTNGKPVGFFEAVVGGRAVGVPGVLRMLEHAHRDHGRLPWRQLFEPAIALARDGFEVSPRLHMLLAADPALRGDPEAAALFYAADGQPHPIGHHLRNPALADTLTRIADRGSLALHAGPIARDIADRVQQHPTNPGRLGEHDLAFYRPLERDPLCVDHGRHRVCGMPPPGGGLAVAQMLGLWHATGGTATPALAASRDALDADGAHRFAEIGRLVFADRDRYLADPAFAPIPGGAPALLEAGYLSQRARLVGEQAMTQPAAPGQLDNPVPIETEAPTSVSLERSATTHLSIVDVHGNAVSMTSSVENAFGSRIMVRGFLLNNQLTDFSFVPTTDERTVANRVEAGKRARSAMAPTMVLERDSGALRLVIGSPGGPSIIHFVARSLIAILDDGIDPQSAVALPNLGNRNRATTELERDQAPPSLADALRRRGHEIRLVDMTSGLHAIAVDCPPATRDHRRCTLTGAVDPRREGMAIAARALDEPRMSWPTRSRNEETEMDRRTIHGGRLKSAGYDAREQLLEIEFVDGTLKTFKAVPAEVWRRFVASPNPASFYADRIDEEYVVVNGRATGSTDARGKLDALFGTPPGKSDSQSPE
ncbi:MAG TPA: gamma-glutamyltransferase, partial [Burkholderiaceae bacterium]|nr:gamma-glutamyltransferase [Burkholderiaceae bacterium]